MRGEEVKGMVITKNDGSTVQITLANLRSIKFSEGNMVIHQRDAQQQTVSLCDVTSITFADITAAIAAVIGDDAEAEVTVTDLAGRVVYRGAKSGELPALKGTYIVSSGNNRVKVYVK